jgi:C4-dicarboxylate-specific signal transduction histidine kinase
MVEHALRISLGGESDGRLVVDKEIEGGLVLRVSRHKVLQILVNLLRNAREALDQAQAAEPRLGLRARRARAGVVEIAVEDNGSGIQPENLTRIFAFGFTTKPDGHGFGLHSSALAAREMGGTLVARSEGAGRGATFLLELPASG